MGLSDTEKVSECMKYVAKLDRENWGGKFKHMIKVETATIDALEPTVVFSLTTEEWMANQLGACHGGCVTTLLDNASAWALFADPRYWDDNLYDSYKRSWDDMGPSRNLNVTFVRPVPVGKRILIECVVQANTKRYAYVNFVVRDAETNKQLALGSQDVAKVTPASYHSSKL